MQVETQQLPHLSEHSLAVPAVPIWRLSVAQYHQMIGAGILTDDDPVELLEGWLVTKMPKHPPHSLATQVTRDAIAQMLPPGWFVNAQEPITLADSEPEPDIVVVRGDRRHYRDHHPGPQDVALIVEVSDATLQRDRGLKQRLYATAGIPVYWIINLPERQIEVYSEPSGPAGQPGYGQRADYHAADELPLVIEGHEVGRIRVSDLLP